MLTVTQYGGKLTRFEIKNKKPKTKNVKTKQNVLKKKGGGGRGAKCVSLLKIHSKSADQF